MRRLKPLEGHLNDRDGVEAQEGEFAQLCYLLTCRSVRDSRLFSWWPGELRGRELLADEVPRRHLPTMHLIVHSTVFQIF